MLLNPTLSSLLIVRDGLALADLAILTKRYEGLAAFGNFGQEFTQWHMDTASKLRK